jgi:hypothetical protein
MRSLWRTLLVAMIALAPTAIYLLEQNECTKISYEVSDLAETQEALVKQEQELKVAKTQLESLSEIERWAVRERGLLQPEPEDVVVVRSGRTDPIDLFARVPNGVDDGTPH